MPANQAPAPDNQGRPQGVQDPERATAQEQSDTQRPTTTDPATSGGKVVRVVWPNNEFIVEGHPVLTNEGTRVKASDVKALQEAADATGVELEVDD